MANEESSPEKLESKLPPADEISPVLEGEELKEAMSKQNSELLLADDKSELKDKSDCMTSLNPDASKSAVNNNDDDASNETSLPKASGVSRTPSTDEHGMKPKVIKATASNAMLVQTDAAISQTTLKTVTAQLAKEGKHSSSEAAFRYTDKPVHVLIQSSLGRDSSMDEGQYLLDHRLPRIDADSEEFSDK